ncbi:hypothetical protein EZS27_022165 [termite gut metagenome]|uniref:Uncharacterized protein n=1 Tax=termite gut metagenome TaxID=433724 RepID=A0A5J4R499_9ZZZZ
MSRLRFATLDMTGSIVMSTERSEWRHLPKIYTLFSGQFREYCLFLRKNKKQHLWKELGTWRATSPPCKPVFSVLSVFDFAPCADAHGYNGLGAMRPYPAGWNLVRTRAFF